MSAQDLILGARVAHLRELKTELAKLQARNAALNEENEALKAHFDLALLAARDLEKGELQIWDGWNLILGARREARDRAELIEQAKKLGRPVWIVFDGPDERVRNEGLVRVSFTGGTGPHRADRFIIDFVRMAAYQGLADRISVRTNDRDFLKEVKRIQEKFGIISALKR